MTSPLEHLPPGHEPGLQTRRAAKFGPLKRALAAPFTRHASGVSLQVEPAETARGETVRVSLTLERGADDGSPLQVGLVCTQFADVESDDARTIQQREAVSDWRDVPTGTRLQSFEFTVPPSGPFSYEGATVSWAWSVSARRPRRLGIDRRHDVPIWVKP